MPKLLENKNSKIVESKSYNYIFDKNTGFFARWGETKEDDPVFSPFGPEIADIEISTICSGVDGVGVCKFCYKSNTPKGENMSLETFKKVFSNLPRTVTQIAFGIGNVWSHPELFDIFEYTRSKGVIPNVTVNGEGITDEVADKLASVCGGVAVSVYDKNKSYDTIKKLTDRGMKNCNIHFMICEQTFDKAKEVIQDVVTDERLSKLHAVVLLSLKPHGRGKNTYYTKLSQERFTELVNYVWQMKAPVGFDSCSAAKFARSIENHPNRDAFMQMVEPCESTKFSIYVNTSGDFYPCSFMEGENVDDGGDWTTGLSVANTTNFMRDIWNHERTLKFREKCIRCTSNGISCPHYEL